MRERRLDGVPTTGNIFIDACHLLCGRPWVFCEPAIGQLVELYLIDIEDLLDILERERDRGLILALIAKNRVH